MSIGYRYKDGAADGSYSTLQCLYCFCLFFLFFFLKHDQFYFSGKSRGGETCFYINERWCTVGMGDMGLKIYHNTSCIYCDTDINDDNSGNAVSLEKSIIFPIFTPNRVL